MKKIKKIKKLSGVIFQSGSATELSDEDLANQRAQQKNLDADTQRAQVGTSESLNPVVPSLGPERY